MEKKKPQGPQGGFHAAETRWRQTGTNAQGQEVWEGTKVYRDSNGNYTGQTNINQTRGGGGLWNRFKQAWKGKPGDPGEGFQGK